MTHPHNPDSGNSMQPTPEDTVILGGGEMPEDLIAEAITEQFGERCPDFDANCYCCRVWKQYDEVLRAPYTIIAPKGGFRALSSFTAEEKVKLRPIAETLAMLDGNAFFGMGEGPDYWSDQYLPEAHALFIANGGDTGWASGASFVRAHPVSPETKNGAAS